MEVTYEQFQSWCKNKTWQIAKKTSFKDLSNCCTAGGYEHRYHFEIITKFGEGNISMFQSNGFYWIDFEAADLVRFSGKGYYIKSVDFEDLNGLEIYFKAFLEVIE